MHFSKEACWDRWVMVMDQIVCLAFLETSIDTKIVSLSVFFFFGIKLMKSVVSFNCFCAIGRSNVSKNEDIRSVGPSQPEMMGLPTGLGLWIFVSV